MADSRESRPYPCEVCRCYFPTLNYWKRHRRGSCFTSVSFHCRYCPSNISRKDNFVRHIKNKHQDKLGNLEDEVKSGIREDEKFHEWCGYCTKNSDSTSSQPFHSKTSSETHISQHIESLYTQLGCVPDWIDQCSHKHCNLRKASSYRPGTNLLSPTDEEDPDGSNGSNGPSVRGYNIYSPNGSKSDNLSNSDGSGTGGKRSASSTKENSDNENLGQVLGQVLSHGSLPTRAAKHHSHKRVISWLIERTQLTYRLSINLPGFLICYIPFRNKDNISWNEVVERPELRGLFTSTRSLERRCSKLFCKNEVASLRTHRPVEVFITADLLMQRLVNVNRAFGGVSLNWPVSHSIGSLLTTGLAQDSIQEALLRSFHSLDSALNFLKVESKLVQGREIHFHFGLQNVIMFGVHMLLSRFEESICPSSCPYQAGCTDEDTNYRPIGGRTEFCSVSGPLYLQEFMVVYQWITDFFLGISALSTKGLDYTTLEVAIVGLTAARPANDKEDTWSSSLCSHNFEGYSSSKLTEGSTTSDDCTISDDESVRTPSVG